MAKCFFTGIDVPITQAYVLDLAAAYRALRSLRQRVSALERLIQQLGPRDDCEIFDSKTLEISIRKDRRVISPAVAKVLETTHPDACLFISWQTWKGRSSRSAFSGVQASAPLNVENHEQAQSTQETTTAISEGEQWGACLTPSRYSAVP